MSDPTDPPAPQPSRRPLSRWMILLFVWILGLAVWVFYFVLVSWAVLKLL
jgi:hypothetical protein